VWYHPLSQPGKPTRREYIYNQIEHGKAILKLCGTTLCPNLENLPDGTDGTRKTYLELECGVRVPGILVRMHNLRLKKTGTQTIEKGGFNSNLSASQHATEDKNNRRGARPRREEMVGSP
jgi:hypothetical protein